MSSIRLRMGALALTLLLAACGMPSVSTEAGASPQPPSTPTSTITVDNEHAPFDISVLDAVMHWRLAESKSYLDAVHAENVRKAEEQAKRDREKRAELRAASAPATAVVDPQPSAGAGYTYIRGIPCGADLPPCFVIKRESEMTADPVRVYNDQVNADGGQIGCYYEPDYAGDNPCGSTASGPWQFLRSTWNWFMGYRNAADAPLSVQIEKARQTWANGRGCSHWAAC